MINELRTILKEFYMRFLEKPPSTTHRINLELDRQEGLVMAPSLSGFLAWLNEVIATLKEIFLGENIKLEEEVLEELFPERDCPEVVFTPEVCEDAELDQMHGATVKLIEQAYDYFAQKSRTGADFLKQLQERLVELNSIDGFEDPNQFVAVADEISDLRAEVESIQRVVNFATLHTDMKPGKTSALNKIKETIEKLKRIGIDMSKQLFDEISQTKNIYIKYASAKKMGTAPDETPQVVEMKQKIRDLCGKYLPVAESILGHWSESAIEIEEQYGNVQDILALVTAVPRGPRRGRGRRPIRRRS
jgi:hypothetical protein